MSASFENANKRYAVLCTYERLAKDKPLPEITVSDICNAHGISRSTFYRLFGGVDDILMWYQNFASDIGMHRAGIMYTFKEGQYTTLALLDRFRHLFNQRYIKNTAYWNPDFSFQCINNHVDAMRRMLESRNVEMTTELLFKLRGVAVVVHEMGRYYARDDIWSGKETLSLEEVVDIMYSFVPDELKQYFDHPVKDAETSTFVEILLRSLYLDKRTR